MKKKLQLIAFVIFFYCMSSLHAQSPYVAIPDANFRAHLEATYPACMSGGMLDTTCAAVVNALSLNVNSKSITDLTGVKYFKKIHTLYCTGNSLTTLPVLPSSMIQLSCNNNQLISLPNLPLTLKYLYCYNNNLTSLPLLPAVLLDLDCAVNHLASLPSLPSFLEYLDCKSNQINCLPALPTGLEYIRAAGNSVVCLPNKPVGISTDIPNVCNDGTGCGLIAGVDNSALEENIISIYPNPSKDIFNISLSSTRNVFVRVQVINQYGSVINNLEAVDISKIVSIDLSNEQKGIYLLRIIKDNKVVSKRLFLH